RAAGSARLRAGSFADAPFHLVGEREELVRLGRWARPREVVRRPCETRVAPVEAAREQPERAAAVRRRATAGLACQPERELEVAERDRRATTPKHDTSDRAAAERDRGDREQRSE